MYLGTLDSCFLQGGTRNGDVQNFQNCTDLLTNNVWLLLFGCVFSVTNIWMVIVKKRNTRNVIDFLYPNISCPGPYYYVDIKLCE